MNFFVCNKQDSGCDGSYSSEIGSYPVIGRIDFSQDFHIWEMTWNKTIVEFFIDGNTIAQMRQDRYPIPYEPEYVIMNVAV